jgi:hypothetical protein
VIYVVLGMHKSGTTLVARLLHESGISMGEFDPRLGYGEGNRCERLEAQQVNRDLLHGYQLPPLGYLIRRSRRARHDAAGYVQNRDSQAYVRHRALARRLARPDAPGRLREVIADCERRHEDWGFKDPRTCLTYPAWRRALPEHRLVVVYRGLGQVLERSGASGRHGLRALRIVHAWCVYNGAILRALEGGAAPSVVLRYESLMESGDGIEKLARFVGRPLKDTRDPALYRARESKPLPAWIRTLSPLLPVSPEEIDRRLSGGNP